MLKMNVKTLNIFLSINFLICQLLLENKRDYSIKYINNFDIK